MNEIEAIEYFESLIKRFEDKPDETYWGKAHNATTRDAISTALTALREKAEISKGCEYCDDNFEFWQTQISGELPNVCFCPMCGKKIEEHNDQT